MPKRYPFCTFYSLFSSTKNGGGCKPAAVMLFHGLLRWRVAPLQSPLSYNRYKCSKLVACMQENRHKLGFNNKWVGYAL